MLVTVVALVAGAGFCCASLIACGLDVSRVALDVFGVAVSAGCLVAGGVTAELGCTGLSDGVCLYCWACSFGGVGRLFVLVGGGACHKLTSIGVGCFAGAVVRNCHIPINSSACTNNDMSQGRVRRNKNDSTAQREVLL